MLLALGRLVGMFLLAALVPIVTGHALFAVIVGRRGAADGERRKQRLAGFRGAVVWVGAVQVLLAGVLGSLCVGPELVSSSHTSASAAVGLTLALVAFIAGGVGRVAEIEGAGWREWRDAARFRLRVLPTFIAPALVALPARHIPLVDATSGTPELIGWGVALRFGVIGLSVAFTALVAMRLTGGLEAAPPDIDATARELAAAEGISLRQVLWMPTGTVRFANAFALPWARTLVVTERLQAIASKEGLRAIVAHEVGHLSEPPWSWLTRLVVLTAGAFAWAEGRRLHEAFSFGTSTIVAVLGVIFVGRRAYHAFSRRLELRADERARALTSPAALADGLEALREDAGVPLATAVTTHPTFHERLVACGRVLPRPSFAGSPAVLLGPVLAIALVYVPVRVASATRLTEGVEASSFEATLRVVVAAWDPGGHRALERLARGTGDEAGAAGHAAHAASAERSAASSHDVQTH